MKKLHLLKTMLLLCALIVGSSSVWGQAPVNTVLWAEDFSGYSNKTVPSGSVSNSHDGTTVYGAGSVTYACENGGTTTQVYFDTNGPHTDANNSNLLISKGNGTFTVSGIPTGSATELTLSYENKGKGTISVSTSTIGVTISGSTITTNGASTIALTFTNTHASQNVRIDDISLIVKTSGSTDPVINATNVEYDADETDGEIAYTITNPVGGKSLSATTSTDWITLGDVTSTEVPFTMSENTGALRQGSITLKYDGATDKVITVTQKALVVKYNVNISEMTNGSVAASAAKAEVGETVTLTITPSAGYNLATIAVTDTDEGNVALSGSGNTRTFTMPAKPVTVSATFERDYSITYDFSFASMGSTGWGGSYAEHTQNFGGATVYFSYASKQSGTITDIPVAKGYSTTGTRYVSLTLTDANATLKSASFALRHWTNKTVTITMYYSTDGGENWTTTGQTHAFTSSTSGEDVTLTASTLPSGTNAVKIEGGADQQYGVAAVTIEVGTKFNINSACTDGEGNYYGTYSNDLAFVVPEGLTVSEIKVEEGKLSLSNYATGETVPANTGIMVAATSAGDKTVTLTTGGTSKLGSNNMLKASGDAGITAANMTEEDTEFYRLTMHNGETIGFWWGAAGGGAFDIAANKAYLAVPSDAGARDFVWFDEGETTSLSEVRGLKSEERGEYYNLNGQRVAQPTKGLYIVNGRKVVIK